MKKDKITFQEKYSDPQYPIMHGDTPFAKAFNKAMSDHWVATGNILPIDDTISQLLINDFNERHTPSTN
jgi:quinol monooxygenase YgiN